MTDEKTNIDSNPGETKPGNFRIYIVCLIAALAGLVFGIDIGVIAQAKDFITEDLNVSDTVMGWIVGSMMGGAACGTLISGFLTRSLGRKYTLIVSGLLFVLSCLGCALAWNGIVLVIARLAVGFSIGIASFTAPLYLSEVAPKSIRGTMISTYQLMITIGILASFTINMFIRQSTFTGAEGQNAADFLIPNVSMGWRAMFFATVVPSLLFLAGVFFLPKSPRWLISKGRKQEALEVLRRIRGSEAEAQSESREIIETVSKNGSSGGLALFRSNPNFRKTVFLGITLQFLQQFCGINIVMYFGPELFIASGFSSEFASGIGTVAIGLTNVLATFIAIAFVDRLGRRRILQVGYTLMTISILALACFMHLGYSIAAIASVLIFIVAFAFSAGPVIWVLCAEIQPLAGRDFGITCSTGANWLSNMAVSASFLPLMNAIGTPLTMLMFALFSAAGILIISHFTPETKGVSLERLESNLMNGVRLRDIGR
ncbi:MAG: sugar porter family MFS transporter [Succinivibrionaceae bacterium]|nr:sugar porter family MFS transporter [Succinivibrionaceae bacterium]